MSFYREEQISIIILIINKNMFQKFFTNTIESSFIKQLLSSIYLPIIKTCHYSDYVCKNFKYIYDLEIIYITKSGLIGIDAEFEKLDNYIPNKFEATYTSRYQSIYSFYDSDTHRYLGDYLRWYRDIYNIDLMPFYNCFNYDFVENLYINNENKVVKNKNNLYKQFLIPIDSNRDYTIALNSSNIIKYTVVFCNKYGLITKNVPQNIPVLQKSFSIFSQPFLYKLNLDNFNEAEQLQILRNEKYLYLLIQLPKDLNTSIVVLEGNYIDSQQTQIFEGEYNLISKLSLLEYDTQNIYAFSDKLIEYLLENVITSQDIFDKDILRVQEKLKLPINELNPKSVWTQYLRKYLYIQYMQLTDTKYSKLDINGFVDKNIERALMEGKLK